MGIKRDSFSDDDFSEDSDPVVGSLRESSLYNSFLISSPSPLHDLSVEEFADLNANEPNDVTLQWGDNLCDIPHLSFDETSARVKVNIDESSTLFPNDVIGFLVESINKYAEKLCHTNRPSTRYR
ncbi:hypothetical protein JTB14_023672 [Gonioctena quinquepunctata]|nr:hypothetical protein JTB14_023672 [Gonioctena quinquepunctata]